MKHELVIYTMEDCGHCQDFKKLLNEADISFYDRDIYEHNKEYDMYCEITGTEYVPAVMLIKNVGGRDESTHFFAPTKDYETIHEALDIIKKNIL